MKIFIIASNELRRLFYSPLAWIILAIVEFTLAVFFYVYLSQYLENPGVFVNQGLTKIVVAGLLHTAGTLLLLITPFLTMRIFSDELRNGTMKLLLSAPISITELVIGKLTGVVIFMFCTVLIITLMPASLYIGTELDTGQLISGVFGLLCLTASFVSIGLFISSLTQYPAAAAASTYFVILMFWVVHIAANTNNQVLSSIFNYLSVLRHYNHLVEGLFSTADITYFIILVSTFTALCIWRINSMRSYHW